MTKFSPRSCAQTLIIIIRRSRAQQRMTKTLNRVGKFKEHYCSYSNSRQTLRKFSDNSIGDDRPIPLSGIFLHHPTLLMLDYKVNFVHTSFWVAF